jgi:hypothetical protein
MVRNSRLSPDALDWAEKNNQKKKKTSEKVDQAKTEKQSRSRSQKKRTTRKTKANTAKKTRGAERKVYVKYSKKSGRIMEMAEIKKPLRKSDDPPFLIKATTEAAKLFTVPEELSQEPLIKIHKSCMVRVGSKTQRLILKE